MIKLVVFDLDGTLLDTLDDMTNACNYALSIHGFPEHTKEDVKSFVGNGMVKLIERALPSEIRSDSLITSKVVDTYSEYYNSNSAKKTNPYSGIMDMMNHLKEKDVKTAILSNKPHRDTVALSERFFENLVDITFGQREGIPHKPNPTALLEIIDMLELTTKETLYIGDSVPDIITGGNARVETIGVAWGFAGKAKLFEAGATTVADTVVELENILFSQI